MPTSPGVRTLNEYDAVVARLKPIPDTARKLFRGQGDAWPLLPNLFRRYQRNVDIIHTKEKESLARLKNRIPWITPLRPSNDWDWLSFGQHYHLKTRMLDWSTRPEIALFFAVEDPKARPTVYVYSSHKNQLADENMKKLLPADVDFKKTPVMEPAIHSVRVKLQGGWHTVHHLHPRKGGGQMVIPLENMEWHRKRLQTITVDPGSAKSIRIELSKRGIRHATVYGDFERVCEAICDECFT